MLRMRRLCSGSNDCVVEEERGDRGGRWQEERLDRNEIKPWAGGAKPQKPAKVR